jgi:hypothetical protein
MRLDPSLTKEDWLQLLQQEANRIWGSQRSPDLGALLERLATALHTTANYEVPAEEEPYLLDTEPFPPSLG